MPEEVELYLLPEPPDPASRRLGDGLGDLRAEHDEALSGDPVHEAAEATLQLLEAPVTVEVVLLEVGHDGAEGLQLEERAVVLAGLDGKPTGGIRRDGVHPTGLVEAAHQGARGRATRRLQRLVDHPRGGRLAVRPGDRQRPVRWAEPAQELGVLDDLDAAFAGGADLQVVIGHRR